MDKFEALIEFYSKFKTQIKPKLMEFEPKRKKELTTIIVLFFIIIVCTFCFFKIFNQFAGYLFAAIGLISLGIYTIRRNKNFQLLLKDRVVQEILDVLGDIKWKQHKYSYNSSSANPLISTSQMRNSGLFQSFNKINVDDEFQGTKNGVDYLISEVELIWDGNKGSRIVFKGIIISFKSNKKNKDTTIVTTRGDIGSADLRWPLIAMCVFLYVISFCLKQIILGFLMLIATIYPVWFLITHPQKPKKVTLEDPRFNKRFKIYSTNQVEARYLLTTSFMNRFYNLKTTFGTHNIKCSFFDDNLMIAISTNNNLFEIGNLFQPLADDKIPKKLFNDINSIIQLVEYFKLDENTGL